ncbi:MAG: hypothetical protein LBD93_11805 [Treponema sp.]|jgi:hypothetical protein|nr:hypothetical protein [Treponema sp.]
MQALKHREYIEQKAQAKKIISRQIDGIDNRIDKAVYKLYGLTPEEIEMIEKAISGFCYCGKLKNSSAADGVCWELPPCWKNHPPHGRAITPPRMTRCVAPPLSAVYGIGRALFLSKSVTEAAFSLSVIFWNEVFRGFINFYESSPKL